MGVGLATNDIMTVMKLTEVYQNVAQEKELHAPFNNEAHAVTDFNHANLS